MTLMADSTMITSRLSDFEGRWCADGDPSFPIAPSDIRRWVIATYWPSPPPPLYWDEAYARTTRWGGIIAPPEFNPFAWPVEQPDGRPKPYHAHGDEPGPHLLNGGQVVSYGAPMRPGDVITAQWRVQGFDERRGRFGLMLYVRVERELRNGRSEIVRSSIDTIIRH